LILCAAGTSLSWTSWWGVIFPANMSETTAVTGIRDGSPMQRCNTCHDGSRVDFVAVMQRRSNTDRTSLTLSRYNNRMKQAASIYPGRSGNFGWGIIDAAQAVN